MRFNRVIIPPFLLVLLVCAPAWASENEVRVGATTAARYSDNVANVERNKTDSFSFEIGPYVEFESVDSRYEVGASYSPRFVTYSENDRDDAFIHNIGVHGDYRPADQWKLALRDVLGIESDEDRDFSDEDLGQESGSGKDKQTFRNNLNGSVTYNATQRAQFVSSVAYSLTEREDKSLSDSAQVSGRVQGNYALSARNTFGGGVLARRQDVSASSELAVGDTKSEFYGFFFYAEHRFTPLLTLSASGGPTWLISNRDDDGRGSKTSLDSFATVSLTAEIDRGSARLGYRRTSTDFAQTATAFIIDEVTADIDYAVTSLFIVGVNAEWNQRKAILKIRQGSFVNDVEQWRAAATASYRFTPELTTHLTFDYLKQKSKQAADDFDNTDRFRVVVRFDYHAKAFRF